jgi:hypothetical protein
MKNFLGIDLENTYGLVNIYADPESIKMLSCQLSANYNDLQEGHHQVKKDVYMCKGNCKEFLQNVVTSGNTKLAILHHRTSSIWHEHLETANFALNVVYEDGKFQATVIKSRSVKYAIHDVYIMNPLKWKLKQVKKIDVIPQPFVTF